MPAHLPFSCVSALPELPRCATAAAAASSMLLLLTRSRALGTLFTRRARPTRQGKAGQGGACRQETRWRAAGSGHAWQAKRAELISQPCTATCPTWLHLRGGRACQGTLDSACCSPCRPSYTVGHPHHALGGGCGQLRHSLQPGGGASTQTSLRLSRVARTRPIYVEQRPSPTCFTEPATAPDADVMPRPTLCVLSSTARLKPPSILSCCCLSITLQAGSADAADP